MEKFKMEMKIGKKQVAFYGVKGYWNYLTEPHKDRDTGKVEYKTQIVISEEMADEIEEKFNKKPSNLGMKNKTAIKNAKKADKTPVLFDGNDDDYILNLGQTATWPSGDPRQLTVTFEDKPLKEPVGAGSTMNILCNIGQTSKGAGLYLEAVKVIDLVEAEFSSGGSDEFEGFDRVDMGEPNKVADNDDFGDFDDDDIPFG
jgi:hypothetical protein